MKKTMSDVTMKDDANKWLSLILLSFILLSSLTGCGFTPVYQKQNAEKLASIEVPLLRGSRVEQLFSTKLADLLNPGARQVEKRYRLELSLKEELVPAVMQQNREITRYRIVLMSDYVLKNGEEEITKGKVTVHTSYDDLTGEFANYSAQVDAQERAAEELSEQIRLRLLGVRL